MQIWHFVLWWTIYKAAAYINKWVILNAAHFGIMYFMLVFYGLSTLFRLFRVRSVNLSIVFLGMPPRQFTRTSNLPHLYVHVVIKSSKNQKSMPIFLSGKKLLKNVTLQILNFIPVS